MSTELVPQKRNQRKRKQRRTKGRSLYRQSGETDPYDITVALLNIYENQVILVGLHNLSNSFRPNLSSIRVLSLGTKFIPKWKFAKKKECVHVFQRLFEKMQNEVYFTETKPLGG